MKKLSDAFHIIISHWINACCLFVVILGFSACAGLDSKTKITSAEAESDFEGIVKPLFEHRCVWCHNDKLSNAGLNLQNRESVFQSDSSFIVSGKPQKSLLYSSIGRHPQHLKSMPADGWKITDKQAQAIYEWIKAGAPWPEGREGDIQKKNYRVDLDDYL